MKAITTKEIMTATPVTVEPGTLLADAARIMLDQHITALPVVAPGGALEGILTDGDLLRRFELGTNKKISALKGFFAPEQSAREFVRSHGRRVAEVMTIEPESVSSGTSLDEVVDIMQKRHFKQLLVVDDGVLVGVVGRRNLLAALVVDLIAIDDELVSDESAEARILAQVAESKFSPRNAVAVRVKNGIAELEGTVFSDAEHDALIVIAENTKGVKGVRDRMEIADPNSGLAFGGID